MCAYLDRQYLLLRLPYTLELMDDETMNLKHVSVFHRTFLTFQKQLLASAQYYLIIKIEYLNEIPSSLLLQLPNVIILQ